MGGGFHFIIALIVAVVALAGGSLLWPRLTPAPRPQLLEQVHDIVIKTEQGEQAAQVMGVSDPSTVEPINLAEIAGSAANSVKNAAQNRAQTIIMSQVTTQLTNQYERLSQEQKEQLQQIVCKPAPEATSSAQ